jgi:hypothetical protein
MNRSQAVFARLCWPPASCGHSGHAAIGCYSSQDVHVVQSFHPQVQLPSMLLLCTADSSCAHTSRSCRSTYTRPCPVALCALPDITQSDAQRCHPLTSLLLLHVCFCCVQPCPLGTTSPRIRCGNAHPQQEPQQEQQDESCALANMNFLCGCTRRSLQKQRRQLRQLWQRWVDRHRKPAIWLQPYA